MATIKKELRLEAVLDDRKLKLQIKQLRQELGKGLSLKAMDLSGLEKSMSRVAEGFTKKIRSAINDLKREQGRAAGGRGTGVSNVIRENQKAWDEHDKQVAEEIRVRERARKKQTDDLKKQINSRTAVLEKERIARTEAARELRITERLKPLREKRERQEALKDDIRGRLQGLKEERAERKRHAQQERIQKRLETQREETERAKIRESFTFRSTQRILGTERAMGAAQGVQRGMGILAGAAGMGGRLGGGAFVGAAAGTTMGEPGRVLGVRRQARGLQAQRQFAMQEAMARGETLRGAVEAGVAPDLSNISCISSREALGPIFIRANNSGVVALPPKAS